jgi:hypothetical protein
MLGRYILVGKKPMPCEDTLTWGKWFEVADNRVALTEIGTVKISTVFLGIDHQWDAGPPLLFETVIFGLPDEAGAFQERCSTWEEAEIVHEEAVKYARSKILDAIDLDMNAPVDRPIILDK